MPLRSMSPVMVERTSVRVILRAAAMLAGQHGGVVGVEDEGALVRALLADAVVVGDGGAVAGAADPLVTGPELEPGGRRRLLDRVQGGEQGRGVHAVAHRIAGLGGGRVGGGHRGISSILRLPWSC